jgi:16S rRNA (cytidine1402-2'-O)-methyltransferase
LTEVRDRQETLVCFEVARRLAAALTDMSEVLGNRRVAIGRELTKQFEEVVRGDLVELATRYGDPRRETLRGEIVLAVSGAEEIHAARSPGSVGDLLRERLAQGESVSHAARAVAEQLGLPRRLVYREALAQGGKPRR